MPHAQKRDARSRVDLPVRPTALSTRALSLKQVVELTNVSKAHIYALIARGEFPQPAKIGRRSIWAAREVERWLEARFAERGQQ